MHTNSCIHMQVISTLEESLKKKTSEISMRDAWLQQVR
jgi:hypothetical protein